MAGWFLLLLAAFVPVCSWGRSATEAALGDAACDAMFLWILWPLLWFRRGGYLAACVLLVMFGLPTSCYYAWFGRQCVADTFAIIAETVWGEVLWFLQCRPWDVWLTVVYPTLVFLAILFSYFKSKGVDWPRARWGAAWLLGTYSAVLIGVFGPTETLSHSSPFVAYQGLHLYEQETEQFLQMAALRPDQIEAVHAVNVCREKRSLVIVLGESTTRRHLGLYGYARPTTPELERLTRSDDGLIVYTDVIAPHAHTSAVVREAFTWADRLGDHDFDRRGSLVQYLQKGGYRVHWLSLCVPRKGGGSIECVLARLCGCRDLTDEELSEKQEDGRLLGPLADLLALPGDKAIILEISGSHEPYEDRYPSQFERFPPESVLPGRSKDASFAINTYDNSIFYNDHIVTSMIESVRRAGGCGALVYFSDHGDDVCDTSDRNLWHEEVSGTRPMYEVPFVVWLAPQYRRCYPEKASALHANRDRKFMTDQLMPTLLDMAGLQCDSLDPSASLCTEMYVETPRLIGRIDYDGDTWWPSDTRGRGHAK